MSLVNVRVAVSNTGPLLSTFQAECTDILRQLYDVIIIPESVLPELVKHGASDHIQALFEDEFVRIETLTNDEKRIAQTIADQIAASPLTKDKQATNHYPEADAIALMARTELTALEILLDERAARQIANARNVPVIGFAGILIRGVRKNLLSAQAVREALTMCQAQGTHYSNELIAQVYQGLIGGTP